MDSKKLWRETGTGHLQETLQCDSRTSTQSIQVDR